MTRAQCPRRHDDRGAVTVLTASFAASLLALIAGIYDGGRYLPAPSDTFGSAAAAARAEAQEPDDRPSCKASYVRASLPLVPRLPLPVGSARSATFPRVGASAYL